MTERVLVTGAGGFVGSHVVEALLELTEHDVVAVDSLRHNGVVDNMIVDRVDAARVTTVVHDLTVPFTARQLRRVGTVDHVIDAASRSSVAESVATPVDFVVNNVTATLTALELARGALPEHFIHLSTDEVYGPGDWHATTDHRPSSPYAASKAAQEDVCRAYARTYGVRATVVVSANMFGERQSQLAFVPRVLRALRRREPITIHTDGVNPTGRRYTYVRNVAARLVALLDVDELPSHVLLPGQRYVDNLDLASRIARLVDLPFDHVLVPGDHARPGYDPSYPDLRAGVVEHWLPEVTFDEGLARTVRWFVDHPEWLELE